MQGEGLVVRGGVAQGFQLGSSRLHQQLGGRRRQGAHLSAAVPLMVGASWSMFACSTLIPALMWIGA